MGKILLTMTCVFVATAGWCNVGVFAGFGQSVRQEKSADVRMVSEEVDIYLLRAGGRVTGSLRYVDRAHYICKFKLRNLTDKTVIVPVGFPLTTENLPWKKKEGFSETKVISRFNFVAGTENGSYAVRYVPYDAKQKYGKIFMWDMVFKPNETINLLVSYEMNGYAGLGLSIKAKKNYWKKQYPQYLTSLITGFANSFGYVTTTGNSWSGKIEKAVFRIHLGEFEQYLHKRGASEDLPTDPYYDKRQNYPVFATLIRNIQPEGWKEILNKRNERTLEWTFTDFAPKQNISITYLFCAIPKTLANYEHYMSIAKAKALKNIKRYESVIDKLKDSNKPDAAAKINKLQKSLDRENQLLSPEGEKEIADVILEFYGFRTDNKDIQPFLEEQTWYPVKNPPTIDVKLRARLIQTSAAGKKVK